MNIHTLNHIYLLIRSYIKSEYKEENITIRLVGSDFEAETQNHEILPVDIEELIQFQKQQKVVICQNCKDIWIEPILKCSCGHGMFQETDPRNYELAVNEIIKK